MSYATHIHPIFVANTCLGCHTSAAANGLNLNDGAAVARSSLLQLSTGCPGTSRVAPGNPAASYLLTKIQCTSSGVGCFCNDGDPATWHRSRNLSASLAQITTWIQQGAQP